MNTKKKIVSPVMLVVCLLGVGMMTFALVYSLCEGLGDWKTGGTIYWVYFAMVAGGAAMDLLFLWGMNTLCCLVWVEDGILYRRGLLFRYCRSCSVSDIQRLESTTTPRGGSWIFIVDSQPGVFEPGMRKSYICLENTEANRRFIASFCGRVVRTYKHRYTP